MDDGARVAVVSSDIQRPAANLANLAVAIRHPLPPAGSATGTGT